LLCTVKLDVELPHGFEVLDPYRDPEVQRVVRAFCERYYVGTQLRLPMWGINPGRFGGGVTGLSFTDPVSLSGQLGIESSITGRREISAEFIGMVIEAYGGPHTFYNDVYLGALSPLGFVRDGVNINFYDNATLAQNIAPFIKRCLQVQMDAGLVRDRAILLGTGALQKYAHRWLGDVFGSMKVTALDHPRFIMQYRRKRVGEYVERYVEAIRSVRAN
jgi:hypothetical protein